MARARLKRFVECPVVRGFGRELPYVALEHVESHVGRTVDVLEQETRNTDDAVLFEPGDVLFGKLRPYLVKVLNPDYEGCASGEFLVLRPRRELYSRFLYYLCLSRRFIDWANATSYGVKMPRTTWEAVADFEADVPSFPEQRAVADFLDRETARIDGLMGVKKQLSVMLQERWRSEVIEAVTNGLAAADLVPVNSSWFARVPADWRIEPLKRRWTVVDCRHRTPAYVDQGYPLVSHAEIETGRVYPGRSGHFVEEADYLDLIEGRRPKRGDIIYTRNAAIGNAGYVDTDEDFAMGQDVCLITSDEQDQRFLTYFLNHVAVSQLAALRLGATFDRINVAQILDLLILCPPPEEQRAIAKHLDARREMYETLAAQLHQQIALLTEHRRALVSAAVTGQVDVPGESA